MQATKTEKPLFLAGQVVMTQGASEALTVPQAYDLLFKHLSGDWGDLCQEDKDANDSAVLRGERILSAYTAPNGESVWIITEYNRSVTTLLLPSEY